MLAAKGIKTKKFLLSKPKKIIPEAHLQDGCITCNEKDKHIIVNGMCVCCHQGLQTGEYLSGEINKIINERKSRKYQLEKAWPLGKGQTRFIPKHKYDHDDKPLLESTEIEIKEVTPEELKEKPILTYPEQIMIEEGKFKPVRFKNLISEKEMKDFIERMKPKELAPVKIIDLGGFDPGPRGTAWGYRQQIHIPGSPIYREVDTGEEKVGGAHFQLFNPKSEQKVKKEIFYHVLPHELAHIESPDVGEKFADRRAAQFRKGRKVSFKPAPSEFDIEWEARKQKRLPEFMDLSLPERYYDKYVKRQELPLRSKKKTEKDWRYTP